MGLTLLSITYKIISNILLSRLTPYAEEIIGDHQCGFRCIRSTTDHRDFKKAYDSVRRVVLCNIVIEFGIPMKLVRLIKMCLNETYSRVRVGKNLSGMFPIRNGLKQDAISPLLINTALEFAIREVQVNQDGFKLNGTHQLLVYADDVNILGGSIHTIKKNIGALLVGRGEIGLEVNADRSKYMIVSCDQNAG